MIIFIEIIEEKSIYSHTFKYVHLQSRFLGQRAIHSLLNKKKISEPDFSKKFLETSFY